MHSGTSVAQPCFTCGAGRETRTPTPKRWYLKPMRLPIPPYPHVGRRYVTMFWKGQARLIAAFRFIRTFIAARSGAERRQARFCRIALAQKEVARPQNPCEQGSGNCKSCPCPARPALHVSTVKARIFMRLHDIIYRTSRLSFCENGVSPTESRNRTAFCALTLPFPPRPSHSARPHGLAVADAGDFTKSTQIGHKLCSNRRN